MNNSSVAVLCCGASMRSFTPSWVEGMPVCAVNRAVLVAPRLTNYWVFQDSPAAQRAYLPKGVRWGMNVMVRPYLMSQAREVFSDRPDVRVVGNATYAAQVYLPRRDPGVPGLSPVPSFAVAILTMIFRGYERVVVYGADFAGTGEPLAPASGPAACAEPYSPKADVAHARRWWRERAMMDTLVELASSWGSEIVHLNRPGEAAQGPSAESEAT